MLTKVQQKRLAREARKLAFECLAGTAPLLNAYSYCGCACAEVVKRATGLVAAYEGRQDQAWHLALTIDGLLPASDDPIPDEEGIVSAALRYAEVESDQADKGPLVFPLLALADALEESSEQPPAGPSKDF